MPFLSGTGDGFVGMSSFVLDAQRLYFRAGFLGRHMIRAAPLSGAPPMDLVTGLSEVGGIAVDAAYVYFTERTSHTVNRVPISGGSPEVLATSSRSPYALAVDGKYVFWSEPDGAIQKIVKSP